MTVNQPLQAVLTQLFPGYGSGAVIFKHFSPKC